MVDKNDSAPETGEPAGEVRSLMKVNRGLAMAFAITLVTGSVGCGSMPYNTTYERDVRDNVYSTHGGGYHSGHFGSYRYYPTTNTGNSISKGHTHWMTAGSTPNTGGYSGSRSGSVGG
ncbi:MAG: hypothetical protein ACM3PP_05105 [Candidatus Saccharibacteria bacterium]